jgi:hypothetical protein
MLEMNVLHDAYDYYNAYRMQACFIQEEISMCDALYKKPELNCSNLCGNIGIMQYLSRYIHVFFIPRRSGMVMKFACVT